MLQCQLGSSQGLSGCLVVTLVGRVYGAAQKADTKTLPRGLLHALFGVPRFVGFDEVVEVFSSKARSRGASCLPKTLMRPSKDCESALGRAK